ncbi:DUF6179 domain-containing protein [Marinicrinis lubricantis]|uniref:DUF6179 domain-containing protein n=1 Tax=Marinicrinis lubricantis TaxID=2086470 RepID=A0ABW1IK06_9BACL
MEFEDLKTHRKLTVYRGIRKADLHRNMYTISLMNEGLRAGLLTTQESARIQHAFMQILQELIYKYTQGESTSVTTETAESLLSSIMYAADAYLYSYEEPERAMVYLKTSDVRRIYEKGLERVRRCFEETKQLYDELAANKLNVPVDAYLMTLEESIPVFLRKYGILFDAHNTMASIDYPLAVDDMRLQGVYYIKQYLERLKLETDFCRLFDEQELLELLIHYGRECRFNFRIELFNIFELVLQHAVFSILSGGKAGCVQISEVQYKILEQQFMNINESQIRSVIENGMQRLQQELQIQNVLMKMYMDWNTEDFVKRVSHAAKHDSLRSVIITWREKEAKSMVLSFDEQDRMSDVDLRRRLQEIKGCVNKEDKIKLIVSRFHSFFDYIDLLESNSLYGDEYEALFTAFGVMELAILVTIVFYEELRNESPDLPSMLFMDKEYSVEWQLYFHQYLKGLSRERLQDVEKKMKEIGYEQITFF